MGYFTYTCSITRTAISCGDRVVLVATNPSTVISPTTRVLNSALSQYFRDKINHPTWNDVYILYAGVGIYNDYGWIENCTAGGRDILQQNKSTEYPNEPLDYYFMCHADAIESLLDIKLSEGELGNPERFVKDLLNIAHLARIELFLGFCPPGGQDIGYPEEFAIQEKINKITKNKIEKIKTQYVKNIIDYD